MKKKNKLLISALPISFILLTLAGCSSKNTTKNDQPVSISDNNDTTIDQTAAQKTLVISEYKCSGCGKCVRVDSEHFNFDSAGRKAIVVSMDNLNSQNLNLAISICRDQAIELI
jgi:ferredoxin